MIHQNQFLHHEFSWYTLKIGLLFWFKINWFEMPFNHNKRHNLFQNIIKLGEGKKYKLVNILLSNIAQLSYWKTELMTRTNH